MLASFRRCCRYSRRRIRLDLPHHENEIAQSEAYLEKAPFARYWVHNGLVQLGGDKMSKSIGNIVNLRDITARGLANAFRLMVLQSHYRAPPHLPRRRFAGGRERSRSPAGGGTV
ncbi:MAG: class I tRNA ligase family protein [Thermomicrobiales bacterium]